VNIRQRIVLLIALTFLALTSIGTFAVFQSYGSSSEVRSVTEGVVPSTMHSIELMGQLKDVQMAAMSMVAATDEQSIAHTRDELAQKKETLQKALDLQLQMADSEAQKGLVKEATESLKNYFSAIDDTANFKLQGMKDMAEANMGATVDQYLREQGALLDTLQIEKRRSKDAAIDSMNKHLNSTTTTLTITTVLAVVLLAAIGRILYQQVVYPIRDMELKMTEISSSQDYTHRLPVVRDDEVGHSIAAFNTMIEKIEESSALVRQKTADIHAMLHNVPQGILTIENGNTIHPEYSDYLSSVIENNNIAGLNFIDVIFEGVNIGADALSQIEAAVGACIGEDSMNFAFNAHLLPSEIEKTLPDGRVKILDLIWSPIANEQDTTERLLLCIRDVTDLKALAKAADAQKRELAMIGEILSVPQDRFKNFVSSARQFLDEIQHTLSEAASQDEATRRQHLGLLFRNMHTVKGNARTYGLQTLTDVLHQAEQSYDDLRQDATLPWDNHRFEQELASVRSALEAYATLNADKLGRDKDVSDASDTQVSQDEIQHTLQMLESVDPNDVSAATQAIRDIKNRLATLGTKTLQETLSSVVQSLPSLALELGKESPKVVFADHGVLLRPTAGDLFRNVFMHLLRNSMDHGIETILDRVAANKAIAGTIQLDMQLDGQGLHLTLRDDGRGLALQRIRHKAIEQGLIDASQPGTPHQVAQLIFASGFSTASAVTEVSGRGVGMDAVKMFIEAAGGQIELKLLADATDREHVPFETRIHLPGSLAMHAPVSARPLTA
jgi:two-component system chemotaxis sensor kinase CheA